ncbi:hypothetical protein BN1221_03415 [Brenneria goodwinii]|uniref:Uncharacterized protein n=1 Tax=Brenneria goodwinii TaxID=1109412 RepID=A0A0G4JYC5_9GAMM|nr:hypothetical protein BN1221_03415 [Brenneria goodwinii]
MISARVIQRQFPLPLMTKNDAEYETPPQLVADDGRVYS